MSNVIQLKPNSNGSDALRNIADMMDAGEIPNEATVVCGVNVFHVGVYDDGEAARDAIFNMTIGIAKLAIAVVESIDDQ